MAKSSPLLNPQTAAETGRFVLSHEDLPARLSATGLANAETVAVKLVDGQDSYEATTAMYKDGVAYTLKASDPSTLLWGPGEYEWTKSLTAGNSGVFLAKK